LQRAYIAVAANHVTSLAAKRFQFTKSNHGG
jgi:hypothetical protein